MAWLEPINLNSVPGKWQLTIPITNNIIKIAHQTSGLNDSFFNGTIAQAEIDNDGNLNLYDLREINSSYDVQIFNFIKPLAFANRCLAFKANPYALLAAGQVWNWTLIITPFETQSTIAQISNNLSTTPTSPIQFNTLRTGLTIYNNLNATIFIDIVNTVSPTSYWFKLNPGDFYEMPQPAYIGALWLVLQSGAGSVQIREF